MLKIDEVQQIRLIEWRNPISEIIPIDIETDLSNRTVLQRVAPSETEVKEEEASIRKWKEGKLG